METTKQNVGELDRNVRFIAGGGLLAMAIMSRLRAPWRIGALLLGTSELLTAAIRYCPINEALGIDTSRESALQPEAEQGIEAAERSDRSFAE